MTMAACRTLNRLSRAFMLPGHGLNIRKATKLSWCKVTVATNHRRSNSSNSSTVSQVRKHTDAADADPKTFMDILHIINDRRDVMNATNPLFPILKDDSYSARTRMSFAPYMVNFSVGAANFLSSMLRVDKPASEMSMVEQLVNDFCDEDDFHYNYYLRDIAALGYRMEDFGDLQGVLRYVYSGDGNGARQIVYNCCRALGSTDDPLIRMTIVEILEAGLVELFTVIYTVLVKGNNDLPTLEYYGEKHVNLEANHKVTAQFSGKDWEGGEENQWKHEEMASEAAVACTKAVDQIMQSFNQMYLDFHRVILATHNNEHVIQPSMFVVKGDPPIRYILGQ